MNKNNIPVSTLVSKLKLEVIYEGNSEKFIVIDDVNIPTAEVCGIFKEQDNGRVKVFGTKEQSIFATLSKDEKEAVALHIVTEHTPCLISSRDNDFPAEIQSVAEKLNIPLYKSKLPTALIVGEIYSLLTHTLLDVYDSIHGVLLKIDDIGVLIRGESGIGKSEIAAELLQRGHFLVADDRIMAREMHPGKILGSSPTNIRGYLELRGVGVVNVKKIFGETSVIDECEINLVIQLTSFTRDTTFNRLGQTYDETTFFSTDIDTITIPVSEGRNIATIIEIAAKHYTLTKRGYTLEEDFLKNLHNAS